MSKIQKNEKGFTMIEVLLVVITLVIIGGAGYFVAKHVDSKNTALNSSTANTTTGTTKPITSTPKTATTVNPYAGWSTYTATDEGLSFKYPSTWKAGNDPCVNVNNQTTGQCFQIQSPQTSASPYIFVITYYWNQQTESALNQGQTIKSILPLSVSGSKTPLSLIADTINQTSVTNIHELAVTDQKYSVGQTVSYIPDVTSQAKSGITYSFSAVMQTPTQQDNEGYTLAQYQSQPDYSNVVKIFQSLSY